MGVNILQLFNSPLWIRSKWLLPFELFALTSSRSSFPLRASLSFLFLSRHLIFLAASSLPVVDARFRAISRRVTPFPILPASTLWPPFQSNDALCAVPRKVFYVG